MSTEIQHTGSLSPRWLRQDFTRFALPDINYTPCRWATARTKNVEEIAKQWLEDSCLAYVFNDPKLGGMELILFRKEMLDRVMTPLLELHKGRAAIQVDISSLSVNVSALKHNLQCLMGTLKLSAEAPTGASTDASTEATLAALETVKGIEITMRAMTASVVVASPKDTEIASLTEDEESLAKEILAEEESGNDE